MSSALQKSVVHLPAARTTVSVHLIDTTTWLKVPLEPLLGPHIEGHEFLECPSHCFLIEHPGGSKLLFDLGTRKDWKNFSPALLQAVGDNDWELFVDKNVQDILGENGFDLETLEAVIWSHWHYDHLGDVSSFPSSTALIVGPGFKDNFLPGYPTSANSMLLESDWEGRELREVTFDRHLVIGGFAAHDYFGDGSFYLIDIPGHTIGHIGAIARTTLSRNDNEKDTFVFMGADVCHHGAEWKPNRHFPLPQHFVPSPSQKVSGCPGARFQNVHRDRRDNQPFYVQTRGFPHNYGDAAESIQRFQDFDAADNILCVIAHETALLDPEFADLRYPRGTLNGWNKSNVAERIRWSFLSDLVHAASHDKVQGTEMGEGLVLTT